MRAMISPPAISSSPQRRATQGRGFDDPRQRRTARVAAPLAERGFGYDELQGADHKGETVLTWWEGYYTGHGQREYVICDDSYHEIARFTAANGYNGDHHEFLISPQDTALIAIYEGVHAISPTSAALGAAWQCLVQELDIETGEVLFEWRSIDHVALEETYVTPLQDGRPGIDYFHLNSIDVDHDDNLLISARETSTVYKIDRKSGEIKWRLGGKRSDFEMGEGTRFAFQHDARRLPDGTISIFDNGSLVFENGTPKAVEESRGIVLGLDERKMKATLVREYTHPDKQYADAAGNMQVLPNGNVFVGWGRALAISSSARTERCSSTPVCCARTSPTGPSASRGALVRVISPLRWQSVSPKRRSGSTPAGTVPRR